MEVEGEDGEWVWVRRPNEGDSEWWGSMGSVGGDPLKVVFTEPAKHWTDAAPIGNGRLGAMVWGGTGNETLQLNGTYSFSLIWVFFNCILCCFPNVEP